MYNKIQMGIEGNKKQKEDTISVSYTHLGTKKSESLLTEFSVLEKKITSGSMAQVPVVHVQKSTMTVERNTAAGNLAVQ